MSAIDLNVTSLLIYLACAGVVGFGAAWILIPGKRKNLKTFSWQCGNCSNVVVMLGDTELLIEPVFCPYCKAFELRPVDRVVLPPVHHNCRAFKRPIVPIEERSRFKED